MDVGLRRARRRYDETGDFEDLISLNQRLERLGRIPLAEISQGNEGWWGATVLPLRNVRISSAVVAHDGWWGIQHAIQDPWKTLSKIIGEHRSPHAELTPLLPHLSYHARLEQLKPNREQLETAHHQIVEAFMQDRFQPFAPPPPERWMPHYNVIGVDWDKDFPLYPWQQDEQRHNPMHPRRREAYLERLANSDLIKDRGWVGEDPSRRAAAYLDDIADLDPTSSKKYTGWLIRESLAYRCNLPEDEQVASETLEAFHRHKHQFEHQDINRYHFGQLAAEASRLVFPQGTRSVRIEQGLNVLTYYRMGVGFIQEPNELQDADMRLLHVTTPEAARYVARGTAWCVRNLEVATDYLASGRLLFIEMWMDDGEGGTGWMPYVLSHLGYRKRYGGEGPDWYEPAAEIMDIENLAFSLDQSVRYNAAGHSINQTLPDRVAHIIRLLDFGYRPFIQERIRVFGTAHDLRYWQQYEQHEKPDDEYGPDEVGRIEDVNDYGSRLLVYAQVILQQRDPWIEAKLLELARPRVPKSTRHAASPAILVKYAMSLIEDRWVEAEPLILANRYTRGDYVRRMSDIWHEKLSDEEANQRMREMIMQLKD